MSTKQTAEIVALQQRVSTRLAELGYADTRSAERLARHLAEVAVLGRAFADSTLPLFLTLNRDNVEALARLAISIKCDLDEITDALVDVRTELGDVVAFFQNALENNR